MTASKHIPIGASDSTVEAYTDGGENGGSQPISSPLDIAGCALWLDASQLTLADGDPVALLPDLSTSGFDATQAVANNKPVCKTNIQNGLRVVRFDPTTHIQFLALSGDGLGLFRNLDGFTIAAASGHAVGDADWWFEAASNDGMAERAAWQIINFLACNDDANAQAVTPSSGPTLSTGAFYTGLGVANFLAGQITARFPSGNAGIAANFLSSLSLGPTPDTDSAGIYLGQNATADTGAQCDMGEVAVWSRILTSAEQVRVLDYLSAKWAA